jgi:Mg2+ and Co2+ transporter CorA
MLKTLLCDENNQFLVVEDAAAISDIVKHHERHLWLDLEDPNPEELRLIQEEFALHPLAIEDASKRHQRPKVDQYDNFYFVVFYSVSMQEPGQGSDAATGRRGLRGTRFHGTEGEYEIEPAGSEPEGEQPPSENSDGERAGAPPNERIVLHEISMFMSHNFLITVHEEPIPEFEEVAQRWYRNVNTMATETTTGKNRVPGARRLTAREAGSLLPRGQENVQPVIAWPREGTDDVGRPPGVQPDQVNEAYELPSQQEGDIGILLYSLLDTLVDKYFPVIDGVVERIEDLEEQIFERYSQQAIENIFSLKKDLLALRKVFAPERDVLNVLTRRDLPIFEQHTIVYLQDVYDHVVRITDSIDTYRDLLSSALDSFLSMQSNRLNITVQTLTSVSIILMSVAAVTGWYGMNFTAMPELSSRFGYPAVIITVAVVVVIETIFFKRKGWL